MARRRRTVGGGALKSGFGFSGGGAHDEFTELTDAPNSYAGQAGKVVIVNPTETGLIFDTEAAIDRHDVKLDAVDTNPQFLIDKISNYGGTISGISLGETGVDPNRKLQFQVAYDDVTIDKDGSENIRVKPLGITDAQVAVANKDGTAATPSMRTLGTGAAQACAGDDVRLSDSRNPLAHDLAGSLHNADTITNLNTKLSDGDVISTKAGEIAALTEKTSFAAADVFMMEDSADTNNKKKIQAQNMPGNLFTKGNGVYNPSGITAAVNLITWRAPFACIVTNVRAYRVGGTGATINARNNGANNHLASALSVSSADTWMDGGAVQNTAYAAGDKLEVMLVTVAGSPTQILIQVDFKRVST